MNPFWKNGGTGLPEESKESDLQTGSHQDAEWLKKALKRAKEQARNENIPLETIVAERYGVSLTSEICFLQVFRKQPSKILLLILSISFGK